MPQPDQDKLNALVGRMAGDLGAIGTGALVVLGETPFKLVLEARP
jgi:hypothetical protein